MTAPTTDNHAAAGLSELDMRIVRAVPPGGNWRDIPEDVPSKRIERIREAAKNGGGSRSTYYGRLRSDRPAYTISTYYHRPGNGCTIHPSADRVITDREAARLQTFPDHVSFSGPARARQAQIGNAVPPLLAAQLAATIPAGTLVDLFSGAGGLSLGATLVGHELVAAVDNDAHALRTLTASHDGEDVGVEADLGDRGALARVLSDIEERLDGRPLDLLVGGPPCQGFSTAGVCVPDDPRNRLLFDFLRAVERWQPTHVLFENVTGLWFRGRVVLDEAMARLAALGYQVEAQVLHAEGFGVPQRRRRLVVQGRRGGRPRWPQPWRQTAEPSYRKLQSTHAADRAPAPFTVGDVFDDLPAAATTVAEPVTLDADAPSDLARWLRSEIALEELLAPAHALAQPEELALFTT